MKNPNIKTIVVHSRTQSAWNIVGQTLGGKHKIARVPYPTTKESDINATFRLEAFEHAQFISYCFNNSHDIIIRIR